MRVVVLILLGVGLFLASASIAAATDAAATCAPDKKSPHGALKCTASQAVAPFSTPPPRAGSIISGVTYGWVEDYARFYAEPDAASKWVRTASVGFFYGPVTGRATDAEGEEWLQVWGNWMRARHFHEVEASGFGGVLVNAQPRRPFGWMLREFEPRAEPGGAVDGATPPLQRYDFVQVYGSQLGSDGALWYDVGDGRWVRYHTLALLVWRERPRGVEADEFWVDVDLTQQTFAAYEGDRMVFAGLHSSGLARWPTRRGLFRVNRTYLTTPMVGGEVGDDYYYIDAVPHTMFFDGDIALHGAFWHDDFGRPKSHGCVNIAPRAAEWLYYWAMDAPGDLRVWVHGSHHSEFR